MRSFWTRLAMWLAKQAGADLRPWTGELEFASTQIEALTLSLDRMRNALITETEARANAEAAYRALLDGKSIAAPDAVWALVPDARVIIDAVEKTCAPGTSGEYKRHSALAALQKRAPGVAARDAALAIELAIRGHGVPA